MPTVSSSPQGSNRKNWEWIIASIQLAGRCGWTRNPLCRRVDSMAMKRNGATVAVPSGRAEKGKRRWLNSVLV